MNWKTRAELLSAQFAHVELHRREDSLVVTEVEPLLDYVLSMVDPTKSTRIQREREALREFIQEKLSKGPLHIRKVAGLFEAWD